MTPEQQKLSDELTKLQRQTVLGIVAGKSQRQAYYDAGGRSKNDKAADATVSVMLSNAKVDAFYQSLIGTVLKESIMTREKAMERLSLIADTRITDILDFETVEVSTTNKDGIEEMKPETIWRMKESVEIQERAASAIKSVTMTKNGPKIEMYDATAAIQQLAKMQGWESAQKVDHSGVVAVLGKEEYKQARKEMLADDDCRA